MNLLHPEVEITPGRRGNQGYQERDKMAGTAVLRLVNETTQENAFTVRLRCDNPFWQEGWYTIQSVAAPTNAAPPASSQADIPGHNKRSVKVFVPPKGTRDIHIRFDVPKRPESRAGRYDYVIEVETQVTRTQEGTARRKDRLTTIPAAANVRPFYKWSLDLTPEQQRVTRRRRSGDFEVVVTNEGNDWLYCDLQLPRPKDLLLECPTLRLAVPPPEPGEMLPGVGIQEGVPGIQRVVPLRATTRLKTFRGELTPQPLTVSAVRVHAPSLPPAAEDGYLSLGSVVASATNPPEGESAPIDRALVYAPPVPAKLIDFFTRGAGSFRAWIAPVLMLAIAIPAALLVFQKMYRAVKIQSFGTVGTNNLAEPGKNLIITGKWVMGSHVLITTEPHGKGTTLYEEDSKAVHDAARNSIPGAPPIMGAPKLDRCSITIPKETLLHTPWDHRTNYLVVQRLGAKFAFLSAILPEDSKPIQIGSAAPLQSTPTVPVPLEGQYKPGQEVRVNYSEFEIPGTLLWGNASHNALGWAVDHVTFRVPAGAPGTQFTVELMSRGSLQRIPAGSITIASPPPPPLSPHSMGGQTTAGAGGGNGKLPKSGQSASGGGGGVKKSGQDANVNGVASTHVHNPPPIQPPQIKQHPPVIPGDSQVAYTALLADDLAGAQRHAQNSDGFGQAISAYVYARQGNAGAAEPLIAIAVGSSDPRTKAMALTARGASQEAGDPGQAVGSYDSAVAADPGFVIAYAAKAALLYKNSPTPAERSAADLALKTGLEQAKTPDEKAAIYYTLAKVYAGTNRQSSARRAFDQAHSLRPSLVRPVGLP